MRRPWHPACVYIGVLRRPWFAHLGVRLTGNFSNLIMHNLPTAITYLMWTSKIWLLRTVIIGLQTNVRIFWSVGLRLRPLHPRVKLHPTADRATFRIPHITHRSAVTFHTFHSRSFRILPSAFRLPQFRILPTTKDVDVHISKIQRKLHMYMGNWTLWTKDTSTPRHFGTGAKMS